MGPKTRWFVVSLVAFALLLLRNRTNAEHHRTMYMVKSPEPIASPLNDEVTFECEMNIRPDAIHWRHFPLINGSDSAPPNMDTRRSRSVSHQHYTVHGKKSILTVDLSSREAAGDYQCLVTYGVSVLASVLGRVSIAEIRDFGPKNDKHYVVPVGNTVALRCDLPHSNPPSDVQYFKSNVPVNMSLVLPTKTLLLDNVNVSDSGTYTCSARNYISSVVKESKSRMVLIVDKMPSRPIAPKFLTVPPSNYTVTAGEDVFLECSAIGNPIPTVKWEKLNGILPKERSEMLPGGLKISKVTSDDQGTYVCSHGDLKHHIMLLFYKPPVVHNLSTIDMKEGKDLDSECTVSGTPDPKITWLINGESVLNDSNIEAIGNKIYFRPIEKRHAGIIQCFATNAVGMEFGFTFIRVYPKQISTSDGNATNAPSANTRPSRRRKKGRRPKKPKGHQAVMIPPSKPNITRLSDESVMVRWSVPKNEGLPISFFKVQYRELGLASQQNNGGHARSKSSRWKTTNADIIPFLRSYQVDNLKPDHVYKFRIAAVYSNMDNKNGPNSAKFHLKREDFFAKNPLPAPRLTHTEALSPTSIHIYWEYLPNPNITTDGFYVNYQPASSAGDYFKVTVDGEEARNCTIDHLLPDTSYDIKIQSYTQSSASDFSPILKQKTLRLPTEITVPSVVLVPTSQAKLNEDGLPQIYIIIGVVVLGVIIFLVGLVALFVVRKRRSGDNDHENKSGPVTEDGGHHIQADSNGYLAKAVPHSLTNGCGPPRAGITITSNPLAEADDNQNQNMIEMACLSSQNNNCASHEASASSESEPTTPTKVRPSESAKNRTKIKPDTSASENYV